MSGAINMEKPPGSTWTDDQWAAVATRGSNVLVAAAAGSGKTAVLVERIIRRITASTDVDRLLVATFTKAAAAEMKDRIRLALEKELERQPESEHLRRQLALMGRASITTLHSFCLDVIRRYYPLIGLDPGFRIANETESELLRLEVLDDLFESRYEGGEDGGAFFRLADLYGGERGDEPLYHLAQQLYDFARSHPWPEHWLREAAASFSAADAGELEESVWVAKLRDDACLTLEGASALLAHALELTRLPAGPAPYAEALEEEQAMVAFVLEQMTEAPWSRWEELFAAIQFGKLKAMRGNDYDKSLQEEAKGLRDKAKKLVGGLTGELFSRSPEQYAEELGVLAPLMSALAELVIDFGRRYEEAKRAKGLLDFGDLEHYCLRILQDAESSPERMTPSVAALEYQQQFDEILLDEYQDTNMVQEAIVSLIERREGGGNRFMVGDVKQSIYRFRLAEPNLFLRKYKAYRSRDEAAAGEAALEAADESGSDRDGLRIDLARNFRSRAEVLDGVNGVFRAIMREKVAELDYDKRAELVPGAAYPPPARPGSCRIELAVLDKGAVSDAEEGGSASEFDDADAGEGEERPAAESAEELGVAQLEARWIAAKLRELLDSGYEVYDGRKGSYRPMLWRDVVILLRATQAWAPILIEELQAQGIPAYAELSSGYFEAVEVETMLSLLRVIDNPYQDIPLAAALRSPLFGLNAEELSHIRILSGAMPYYDAVLKAAGDDRLDDGTRLKLSRFLDSLDGWREEARQGALAELLWRIYRDTGYYDFAGGLPGGAQRQANLRALYDRARQYEATSFRGLFRFLRFIERMRDSGGDLGTARAMGEAENVVRIMSIHKSKGLEFPVVFVAGLGKMFNQQDLRSPFLMHKELGFGPRFVDTRLRISYPTLPALAIRRAMRMELLAEEMRILYVALTRPKEKLFLVGTVADAEKKLNVWKSAVGREGEVADYQVASARMFLDWLGPLAASQMEGGSTAEDEADGEAMPWTATVVPFDWLGIEAAAAQEELAGEEAREARLAALASLSIIDDTAMDAELHKRLEWQYPHGHASRAAAKTSVTEMKRLASERASDAAEPAWLDPLPLSEESRLAADVQRLVADSSASSQAASAGPIPGSDADADAGNHTSAVAGGSYTFRLRRPAFMEEKSLTAAEKGSASHLLMQHVPLGRDIDEPQLEQVVASMVERRLLTGKQAEAIDIGSVAAFYRSELGKRLQKASWVRREVPFSCIFPARRVYPDMQGEAGEEKVLIQGVIDCLFEDERGLVLVDYKTDSIYMKQWDKAAERHRFQINLYAEAIESVLGRKVTERCVFFFDGGRSVAIDE